MVSNKEVWTKGLAGTLWLIVLQWCNFVLGILKYNKKLKIEPEGMFCNYYFLKWHLAYWQGKRKKNNYSFTTSVAFEFSPNFSEHLNCKINNNKQLSFYFVSDGFTKQMFGQKKKYFQQ